ncbi:hypothetical protein NQ318_006167 [Aromia moschata]|uniref:HTH psq-type domain-containing protein n=1 Tax=Aromia moschata TaxID=1265417 RepID=A0AAV8XCP4_9CUCU|nr:hypothetical protein NQ318_006167 [Aromia moschata]
MPRNYKRQTDRKSWSSDNLKRAIEAIKGGCSIRKTGRDFLIPESTLRDKLKFRSAHNIALGRKATFTPEQEQELVEHVVKLAKLFYGVTPLGVRKIAYDFASKSGINHNFSNAKQVAGKNWFYLFLKRNPQISLRQPKGTSINRISSFNAEETKYITATKRALVMSLIETVKFTLLEVQNRLELQRLVNAEEM